MTYENCCGRCRYWTANHHCDLDESLIRFSADESCMDYKEAKRMKEGPILFSTPMVKAILEGRKTMTRRVINPRYRKDEFGFLVCGHPGREYILKCDDNERMVFEDGRERSVNPPYDCGDILWVRETWRYNGYDYRYKADMSIADYDFEKWRPSIFMPREAARLFLEVKNVRPERLQAISEEDARAEGINQAFLEGWLKNTYKYEPAFWIYLDDENRYWCEKHIDKGVRNFRREVRGKKECEVPASEINYMFDDAVEEEHPIQCEECGKPLSLSALPSLLDELDYYLDGRFTAWEAPLLKSLMHDYPKELFSQKNIHRLLFSGLWNNINAKRGYSWENNPWVWVIKFERIERQ